jgi:hypothetical protein
LGLFLALATSAAAQDTAAPLPQTIQFNRDIRPILSDKCFTCHGPDKTHRTTAFHFDVEESAKQDLGGGHLRFIPATWKECPDPAHHGGGCIGTDAPASTGRTLSQRDIAMLKAWIQQGAKWEKHWSFEPPKRPDLPKVADASWAQSHR